MDDKKIVGFFLAALFWGSALGAGWFIGMKLAGA